MSMQPSDPGAGDLSRTAVAAVFVNERDVRAGVKALRDAGFGKTWIGKARAADPGTGETTIETDGNPVARFFSAGSDRRPLHDVLFERGLTPPQVERIQRDIAVDMCIVTVDVTNDPERAVALLRHARGQVIDRFGDAEPLMSAAHDRDPSPLESAGDGDDERMADADDAFVYNEFYAAPGRY
jgi:hypothetical protein